MTDEELNQRLNDISEKVDCLILQISELETEKADIINIISERQNSILKSIPARVRNALHYYGIDTAESLLKFLCGDTTVINLSAPGFSNKQYLSAKNPTERLQACPYVGIKLAEQTVKILESQKFI